MVFSFWGTFVVWWECQNLGRKLGIMNKGGFSWKRFLGISQAKARLSRQIGIPLTRSGRQRKNGAAMGCLIPVLALTLMAGFLLWIK
jgi:hypothetical protein